MKKKNIDKKVVFSIGGLCVLCLILLAGTWYLNYEPTEEFTPAATQEAETLVETWDDKLDSGIPEASIKEEEPLYTGEVSDNTQTVISEDENGSTIDLSGCVTKEEAQETKPTEKPVPIGDTTNKDEVPSYPEELPVTTPEVQPPTANSESSHPGQVYDPVFGWIDTGNTTYDVVDSDGDINKQIGTMGE
jgi:hypothetical protein